VFEPGAATILGICDLGDGFRLVRNEVDVIAPENRCQASGRMGGLGAQAGSGDVGGVVDRSPGSAPHHSMLSTAVDTEQLVDFANLLGVELLIIDGSTNRRDFRLPDLLEPGALPPLPRGF
jgi:L-arabinose isomerase